MKWRCTVCNYIHNGESPPDFCPNCGSPKEKFVRWKEINGTKSKPGFYRCS